MRTSRLSSLVASALLALALVASTNVWAAISVTGISGASEVTLSGTPTMFGALGGPLCGTTSPASVCNSCIEVQTCTTAPLCVCSEARIHSSLNVHVALKKEAADTGNAMATITQTSTTGGTAQPVTLSGTSNGGDAVDFPWSEACRIISSDSTCGIAITGTNTGTLTIWIDKNGDGSMGTDEPQTTVSIRLLNPPATQAVFGNTASEGIGAFTPYPGDEKIYIENTNAASGFPNLTYSGISTKVRVFITDTKLDDAHPRGLTLSPGTEDLGIDTTTNELIEHKINDLANGTRYYFRIAIVDNAGNIVQYFPDIGAATDASCNDGTGQDGVTPIACPYSAVPSEVLGLLSKDLNCFVATAAYGSQLEPKLKTFRDFRYKVLLRHDWGIWLVKKYYSLGPIAAQFIYDKPTLRAVTRALLWPAFGFSWLSLQWGLVPALFISLLLLASLIGSAWYGFKRSATRV